MSEFDKRIKWEHPDRAASGLYSNASVQKALDFIASVDWGDSQSFAQNRQNVYDAQRVVHHAKHNGTVEEPSKVNIGVAKFQEQQAEAMRPKDVPDFEY
ncbi:MAG: hypothetical protein AAF267_23020 [Deinococcota bacterium]